MMKACCLGLLVMLIAGCAYQDLKAPYEIGATSPVLNQWNEQNKEKHESNKRSL